MNPYMQLAVETARMGVETNMGGPFGAVILRGSEVIAVAHNEVLVRLMYSRQDQWREDALLIMFECNKPWSFDRPPYLRGKLVKRVTSLAKELPEQRRTQMRLLNRGSPSR